MADTHLSDSPTGDECPATGTEVKRAGEGKPRRGTWRRPLFFGIGALALLALLIGGVWLYWTATGRFFTVHRGHLYRSAAVSPDRLVGLCRRHGIRTVVDLRQTGDDEESELVALEAAALSEAGVKHVHLPSNQVPDPEVVVGFLQVMDGADNHPVLIHCKHGVGRTGLFTAVYRMEYQGWTNERARREARIHSGFDSFGRDSSKGLFIMNYRPRHAAEADEPAGDVLNAP